MSGGKTAARTRTAVIGRAGRSEVRGGGGSLVRLWVQGALFGRRARQASHALGLTTRQQSRQRYGGQQAPGRRESGAVGQSVVREG